MAQPHRSRDATESLRPDETRQLQDSGCLPFQRTRGFMSRSNCVLVTGLLLAGLYVSTSSASTGYPAGDVEVVVNGAPVPRYPHAGRWYVEAFKGREYAIRIRNPYPVRVGVALSVDGLNTIDARQTSATDARKWVLGPYETVTISGWQTSRTDARRFEFTSEERSYALGPWQNRQPWRDLRRLFRERPPAVTSRELRARRRPGGAAGCSTRRGTSGKGWGSGWRPGKATGRRLLRQPGWDAGPGTPSLRFTWTSKAPQRTRWTSATSFGRSS